MKPESSNIREVSHTEVHAAELIASGWPEGVIHDLLKNTDPVYRVPVIAELVRDYKFELMSKMNLYRVVCNLETIKTQAMAAGEYDAAAIAAARLADLLPSVPQP